MPPGSLPTVPLPLPLFEVERTYDVVVGIRENVAVQLRLLDIVTDPSAQSALPLHPVKVEPDAAVAVSLTDVPLEKLAWQAVPHEIPAGWLTTVPLPSPAFCVASAYVDGGGADASENVAEMLTATLPLVTHGSVPAHPPPVHPVNTEPDAAVAVSVTRRPAGKLSAQSLPQLMPVGLLTTVPPPVPAFVSVMLNVPATLPQASFEYPESPASLDALTR
jgi:hypothetical protein